MAFPTDFVRLLRGKYDQQELDELEVDAGIRIAVNQQLSLRHIRVVDLSNSALSQAGLPGLISQTSPSIQELDLSYTHLHQWTELLSILSQLRVGPNQALEFLALSGVELQEESRADRKQTFPGVKTLVVSGSRHSEVSAK